MKTQRELQGEKTKENIYRKAIELFTGYGFNEITVDQICSECGIAKGTFYVHYKSKLDIIKQIYKERAKEHMGILMSEYEGSDPLDKLYYYNLNALDFCRRNGVELTALSYSTHLKGIVESHENWYSTGYPLEQLITIVDECINAGKINPSYTSEKIVSNLMIIINGAAVDWALSNGEYDIVEHTKPLLYDMIYKIYAK